jgi:hypothetical protein
MNVARIIFGIIYLLGAIANVTLINGLTTQLSHYILIVKC